MDDDAQAESIRNIVLGTIARWGVSDARLREIEIVRNGARIGRKYEIDAIRAIWLRDRDVIIFSGRDHSSGDARRLIKTVSVSEALSGSGKVA